jgi:hypothetical protein
MNHFFTSFVLGSCRAVDSSRLYMVGERGVLRGDWRRDISRLYKIGFQAVAIRSAGEVMNHFFTVMV